ncbi:gamma-glutamylcyclotransferase [Caballeronia sp. 15711]|uniref:gamma-glutamylcyclotransferase n=1 Tax=Caballeronia sp. 15711 TaxID=3391029 RepID=UPI0039E42DB8
MQRPTAFKLDRKMAMLTREAIKSGAYLEHFESQPNLWTRERIQSSLTKTMQARPVDLADTWIFAYGSLMWNPMVEFEKRQTATLHGWHRSFCLRMVAGRGTPDGPGRMLALRRGDETNGVALKLADATLDKELQLVWIREMVLGSYRPTWASITLEDGTETDALTFVADERCEQFEQDSTVATVAPLISTATGQFGSNTEYLLKLHKALLECGLQDSYIEELASEVGRLSRRACCDVIDLSE